MDVILLRDVDTLGKEGSVVRVKSGYARNFLMPQRLAVEATPAHKKSLEEHARQTKRKRDKQRDEALKIQQRLEAKTWTFTLTVGDNDAVFGSVTAHEIAEALAQEQAAVTKHAVHLREPIKTLGEHTVPVKLHADVTATLRLNVVKA